VSEPIDNELRMHRRITRLDPDSVCALCLERDIAVLNRRRVPRHLLEAHHVVLARHDESLWIVLCQNCHLKIHSVLRSVGVDPKAKPSGFLDRLAVVLRALGSFFAQLARSLIDWGNHLDALIARLDIAFPAWRELGEAAW
jgi:hypothetical protein